MDGACVTKVMNVFWWVLMAALSGCEGEKPGCVPDRWIDCVDGVTYGIDSCGNPSSVIERCGCGCNPEALLVNRCAVRLLAVRLSDATASDGVFVAGWAAVEPVASRAIPAMTRGAVHPLAVRRWGARAGHGPTDAGARSIAATAETSPAATSKVNAPVWSFPVEAFVARPGRSVTMMRVACRQAARSWASNVVTGPRDVEQRSTAGRAEKTRAAVLPELVCAIGSHVQEGVVDGARFASKTSAARPQPAMVSTKAAGCGPPDAGSMWTAAAAE